MVARRTSTTRSARRTLIYWGAIVREGDEHKIKKRIKMGP
jgi:hypothetical protein